MYFNGLNIINFNLENIMNSFEIVDCDDWEKVYVSLEHDLRIVKTNSRCNIYTHSSSLPLAELIGASDEFINKKIKQLIKGE